MPPGMENLRHGSFHWIPQQHDQSCARRQRANAGGYVGMKERKGGDVSSPLTLPVFLVLGKIPTYWLLGVQAEVVHLLAGRQLDLRVLLQ